MLFGVWLGKWLMLFRSGIIYYVLFLCNCFCVLEYNGFSFIYRYLKMYFLFIYLNINFNVYCLVCLCD